MTRLFSPIILLALLVQAAHGQLVINEFSNGPSGTQEYVELLVAGTPACGSCVDIRGWIIDDNNGYFLPGPGSGIAAGHMRLSNNAQWQCVGVGAMILIYNNDDRNPAIPPDDPTDANGDCIYIVPHDNASLIEFDNSVPNNSTTSYSGASYSSGSFNWGSIVGARNSGDSYQTVDPSNLTVPYHAISYGDNVNNSIIYFSGSGTGAVYSMLNTTSDDPYVQANWAQGTAGVDETPGAPNNTANDTWISTLNSNCSSAIVVDAGNDTTICPNTSAVLVANSSTIGFYTWSTGQTGSRDTVAPLAQTLYYVTVDNGACTGVDSVLVSIGSIPTAAVTGVDTICPGTSTTLTASGGTNFLWNTSETTASITVSPTVTTTYSVVVYNAISCADTAQMQVVVLTGPTPAISGNLQVCQGDTTTLSVSPATNPLWSTGETSTSIQASSNIDTLYWVEITDANGCTGRDTVLLNVKPLPIPNIVGNFSICSGDTTMLTATGGTGYQWSIGSQSPTISVSPVLDTTYTVTVYAANGCPAVTSKTVTVNLIPVGLMSNDTTICPGAPVTLSAFPAGHPGYDWSTGQSGTSITVNPITTTTYTLTVTSAQGCQNIASVTVSINPNAVVATDSVLDASCGAANGTIIIKTLGGTGPFTYALSQGGVTLDSLPTNRFDNVAGGTYTVTVYDAGGCFLILRNVHVGGEQQIFASLDLQNPSCAGDSNGTIMVVDGDPSFTYSLNGGAAQTDTFFTGLGPGTYSVVVTDTSGCADTLVATLLDASQLSVQVVPDSTLINEGETISLVAQVSGGTAPFTFAWVPSSGLDCDNCEVVSASPDSTTYYTVMVADANGCTADSNAVVLVAPIFNINTPKAFSPNGDGVNDYFRPLANEPFTFEMKVFNRWGEVVYEGTSHGGWDGVYKGEEQPIATYVYYIRYVRTLTGERGMLKGSITLLR